jgi:hypothetical protein
MFHVNPRSAGIRRLRAAARWLGALNTACVYPELPFNAYGPVGRAGGISRALRVPATDALPTMRVPTCRAAS